jgi:hypothetical protein
MEVWVEPYPDRLRSLGVVARDQPRELPDGPPEILRQRSRSAALEEREQPAVVPELIACGLLGEPLP